MTLDEAYYDEHEVTAREARREVEKHGSNWTEFLQDVGTRDTYQAWDVLGWLGY